MTSEMFTVKHQNSQNLSNTRVLPWCRDRSVSFEVRLTVNSRGHAEAVVLGDQLLLEVGVDGVVVRELDHLLEGVVDEDEADEAGEALLREPGEVLDQEAGVGGHQHQAEERRPQADPQPELQVVEAVVSASGTQRELRIRDVWTQEL